MAKYTIECTEEERDRFQYAFHGDDLFVVIWNYQQWLRDQLKYGEYPEDVRRKLEEARTVLDSQIDSRGLTDLFL